MNLQTEIEYFRDLRLIDKARLLNLFLHELFDEARSTCGSGEQVRDPARLWFVNDLAYRLTRVIEQLIAEDGARPADEIVVRMLLASRNDKVAERMAFDAYRRAVQGFKSYDTTVLMG